MEIINTVFKFNTKENGYSFFWTVPDGTIIDSHKLDDLFPKKRNSNSSGFMLAMTCYRIDRDSVFVGIKNDWNISDTFGRQGLSLCQGNILSFNSEEYTDIFKILDFILSSLKFYQRGYETLESLLSQIALNDSREHQKNFFLYLDGEAKKSKISLNQNEKDLIMSTITKLDVISKARRVRVYSEFPLHEYIGLCCLIGLQLKSSDIQSVGIGDLKEYNNYNHISTVKKVEGFEDVNINQIFEEIGIFYKDKIKKSFIKNVIAFFQHWEIKKWLKKNISRS